jgi:hypothetical protein
MSLFKTETLTRAERRRRSVHAATIPENIGVVEVDHIPIEVANAMLFTPGTKLTTAMRKNCLAARETVFGSTREGKEYTSKLRVRAKNASALQLVKWANRTTRARAKVNRDYLKLLTKRAQLDPLKLHDIAKAERVLKIMDITAQNLDLQMNSYRSEAEARLINHNVFNPVRD